MSRICVILWVFFVVGGAKKCYLTKYHDDLTNVSISTEERRSIFNSSSSYLRLKLYCETKNFFQEFYTCPGDEDPPEKTKCCQGKIVRITHTDIFNQSEASKSELVSSLSAYESS